MSLTNSSFINLDGSVVGGRTPTKLRVLSETGQALNPDQLAGVKSYYAQFCTKVKLSVAQQHTSKAILPDGTVVWMASINGVDSVAVWPTGGGGEVQPLPLGIVISLFKVTVNEDYNTPYWISDNNAGGHERIDITLGDAGVARAAKYPGAWKYGNYNVLVEIDGKKKLSASAFADGQIKFHLVPSNVITATAVPSLYVTEKAGKKEWGKRVVPWYAGGAVTMGSWTLAVPNVAAKLGTDKVIMFAAVDVAPYRMPYDQKLVKGWLFFVTTNDTGRVHKLYARRVLGLLDPTTKPSNHDSELECKLLDTQTYSGTVGVARFGYDLTRTLGMNGASTLKSSGEMYEGEVVSVIDISLTKDTATGTLTLNEVYVPPQISRPTNTYSAQLTRTVSGLIPINRPGYPVGVQFYCYQTGDLLQEDETSYQGTPGEQDPWTGEWVILPGLRTVIATRTKSLLPKQGVDLNNPENRSVSASHIGNETVSLSSSGPNPGDNYSVTLTESNTIDGNFSDASAWNPPPGGFDDTHFEPLAADQSQRKLFGVATKIGKVVSFSEEGHVTVSTLKTSLVLRSRDSSKEDVVLYDNLSSEFKQPLWGIPPVTSGGYGVRIFSSGAPITCRYPNDIWNTITLTAGAVYARWMPFIDPAGTWDTNLGFSVGGYARKNLSPESEAPYTYPAPVPSATFSETMGSSYSAAQYSASFGVSTGDLALYGATSISLGSSPFGAAGSAYPYHSTSASASLHGALYQISTLRGFTPRIFNDWPKLYADPRNDTFIFQMAGYGSTFWTGRSSAESEPMLRLLVGNKFGAIPLEPQITAWITRVNEARAAMTPPKPALATYEIGDLFIDYDEALPKYESPLY